MVKKREEKPFKFFWESEQNLFEELDHLQHRMNDLMRRVWENVRPEVSVAVGGAFPVDVAETEDEIVVRANLPGINKKNVVIRATSNTLEISAKQEQEQKDVGENYFRQERRVGAFQRTLALPAEVDPDRADAQMENGVLEVRLPKIVKGKKRREIRIK